MPDRTNNETLAVIRRRRSVRSYTAAQITDDELAVIVEAGMYAPHGGDQAWHLAVVQRVELLAELNAAESLGVGACWLFFRHSWESLTFGDQRPLCYNLCWTRYCVKKGEPHGFDQARKEHRGGGFPPARDRYRLAGGSDRPIDQTDR